MACRNPAGIQVCASFRIHLGPRFEAAGLRIQFHDNQPGGIHFKTEAPEDYRAAFVEGIMEGMTSRFPDFMADCSIWVTEVMAHEVDSSQRAFYRAGRLVVDQAYSICEIAKC